MRKSKVISLILAFVMIVTALPLTFITAAAEDNYITSGDWTYEILSDGTIRIAACDVTFDEVNNGEKDFEIAYLGDETNLVIPTVIDGYTVSEIGSFAFFGCEFESVEIPNSIRSIGDSAFVLCENVTDITLPNIITEIPDYCFFLCPSLTNINLNPNITSIGAHSFEQCESLTDIIVPTALRKIGAYAFLDTGYYYNEENWTEGALYFGNFLIAVDSETIGESFTVNARYVADYALADCDTLTTVSFNRTVEIGEGAFYNCCDLTTVNLPSSLQSIGVKAFEGCTYLERITIPANTLNVGAGAFKDCTSLYYINVNSTNPYLSATGGVLFNKDKTEIICYPSALAGTTYTIPSTVKTIADEAFENCLQLNSVIIPDGMEYIGNSAFINCSSITSITLPNSVKYIGEEAFYRCSSLTQLTLSDNLEYLGKYAFGFCRFSSIEIPEGIEEIREGTFYYCTLLNDITLNSGLVSIGDEAFYNCYSLEDVVFPNTVTKIGERVFYYCSGLNNVTVPESVVEFGEGTLNSANNILGVPGSAAEAYANENNINFIPIIDVDPGDLNNDGSVDINDYSMVKAYIAGTSQLTKTQMVAADIDNDGAVDAFDLFYINKMVNNCY